MENDGKVTKTLHHHHKFAHILLVLTPSHFSLLLSFIRFIMGFWFRLNVLLVMWYMNNGNGNDFRAQKRVKIFREWGHGPCKPNKSISRAIKAIYSHHKKHLLIVRVYVWHSLQAIVPVLLHHQIKKSHLNFRYDLVCDFLN